MMPSWHAAKSRSGRLAARSTPLPRQQLADAPHRMIGKAGEDIGEPSLRVDAVELGGLDQRVDGGGAAGAFVGAGKGPVVSSDGNLRVILPISGRRSRSIIAGTPFTGVASGVFAASSASLAASSMSRQHPAW